MNGQVISLAIAVIAVPAVLVGWAIVAHNLRVWRVRKLARNLPVGTRERILARIADAARGASVCTLLVPVQASADVSFSAQAQPPDITASRFGGAPYGEVGEEWPTREDGRSVPAEFLIQVRLDDQFPPPWPGRLVAVFLKFDPEQTVRIYPAPSSEKHVPRSDGPEAGSGCGLMPLPIPRENPSSTNSALNQSPSDHDVVIGSPTESPDEENVWQLPYDPDLLLEVVPGLRDELRAFTRRPADLLAQLIAPNHYGYAIDLSDVVQLGGQPQWVQDDPGPMTCAECGEPLRFLFQFGDLSGQSRLGDAGVCFVFGCDAHPETARSLVQMC